MNTLPPFYVGQRVVCVLSNSWGMVKKGEEFTVTGVYKSCCGWTVSVGICNPYGGAVCIKCNKEYLYHGEMRFSSVRFAPIQTDFQQITYQQVMENESSLINCN